MEAFICGPKIQMLVLERSMDQGELLCIVIFCKAFICFFCWNAAQAREFLSIRLTVSVEREHVLVCLKNQLAGIENGAIGVENHCLYIGFHACPNYTKQKMIYSLREEATCDIGRSRALRCARGGAQMETRPRGATQEGRGEKDKGGRCNI